MLRRIADDGAGKMQCVGDARRAQVLCGWCGVNRWNWGVECPWVGLEMALAKKRIFATDTHRFTQIKTRKNALLLCTLILKQGLQVHRSKRTRMNCPAAAQRGVRFGKRPPGSQESVHICGEKILVLLFSAAGSLQTIARWPALNDPERISYR